MPDLTEEQRLKMRSDAERRCGHEDKWTSNEEGFTADACWDCLLDAYFDEVLGENA